jgi:cell division protein FtsB
MSAASIKSSRSISQFLATFLSFGLFVYFFYHLVHGDHGYFAWKGVEEKQIAAQDAFDKTKEEREVLEKRVKMLRPDSLDLDMLDERARTVLGFMKPNEVVVLDKAL